MAAAAAGGRGGGREGGGGGSEEEQAAGADGAKLYIRRQRTARAVAGKWGGARCAVRPQRLNPPPPPPPPPPRPSALAHCFTLLVIRRYSSTQVPRMYVCTHVCVHVNAAVLTDNASSHTACRSRPPRRRRGHRQLRRWRASSSDSVTACPDKPA
jgi:hypothetical protein